MGKLISQQFRRVRTCFSWTQWVTGHITISRYSTGHSMYCSVQFQRRVRGHREHGTVQMIALTQTDKRAYSRAQTVQLPPPCWLATSVVSYLHCGVHSTEIWILQYFISLYRCFFFCTCLIKVCWNYVQVGLTCLAWKIVQPSTL